MLKTEEENVIVFMLIRERPIVCHILLLNIYSAGESYQDRVMNSFPNELIEVPFRVLMTNKSSYEFVCRK